MRRPPSSRLRAARGQVSWVTAVLVLAVLGGGYLAWVWVPVYIYKFQAEQVTRDFMNQAVKNRNDRLLVDNMAKKLRMIGTVEVAGEDGARTERPAVEVDPSDITWERDAKASPPMLHVAFDYTAKVEYPFLERQDEKVVSIEFTQDIAVPDWGPSR
jgi:hypothetical protein